MSPSGCRFGPFLLLFLAASLFPFTPPPVRAQSSSPQPAPIPGQSPSPLPDPIAIVPLNAANGQGPTVTGALAVTAGQAMIAASGTVTAGPGPTNVILPRRGTLRVCASTTVKLASDAAVPSGEAPGLLMAIDHGAVEMSFANTSANESNADVLLTPDFRILIGGPGASEVKVRLGNGGDTCVDNSGADAPYVVVTSLFAGGLYRVQPGQRVMFQHGSLSEVVDQETEPCGCPPPPAAAESNEFPLAQSEGLAPTPPESSAPIQRSAPPQVAPPLVYSSPDHAPQPAAIPALAPNPAVSATPTQPPPPPAKKIRKPGIFARIGHLFRRIFASD
jgi:hypothetical protein